MKRILTGITPSGYPHLGNYIGAIKPSLELLDEKCESFLFIADLHALIKVSDPEQLNQLTHGIALAWMHQDWIHKRLISIGNPMCLK